MIPCRLCVSRRTYWPNAATYLDHLVAAHGRLRDVETVYLPGDAPRETTSEHTTTTRGNVGDERHERGDDDEPRDSQPA